MKKFFSLLCAFAIVLGASAAPQMSKKDFDEKVANKEIRVKSSFKNMDAVAKRAAGAKTLSTVARAPQAKKDLSFTIAVTNITTKGAHVSVTPSNDDAAYFWNVFETADIADMSEADLAAYIKDELDYYIMLYSYFYGMEVSYADFLSVGADEDDFSLDQNTSYTVVVLELDENGDALSASTKESFTTLAVVLPNGGDFEMVEATEKFYATDNDVWVHLYDSAENAFAFDIIVAEGASALESGHTYTLDDMIANYSYAKYDGVRIEYASATLTKTVAANGDYEIAASFVDTLNHTWNLHYQYIKPVKNREENLTVSGLEVNLFEGGWQLYGLSADETKYVSIAAEAEGISGTYTEADLLPDYSIIYTDIEWDEDGEYVDGKVFTLISANINVVYNEADSTMVITGTFLGQDGTDVPEFTLNLSGKVPAPEVSDMTFTFAKNNDGIKVIPSANDPWDWYIASEEVFEYYGADYIAEAIFDQYGNTYAVEGTQTLAWDEEISWYTTDEDTGETIPGNYVLVVWGAGSREVTTEAAYYEFSIGAEGIENVVLTEKVQKVVVDGVVYIVRDNKMFDVRGTQVR